MSRETRGLSDIRTGQKAKIRSMPRRRGKNYLGLFSMTKEKERLEKELLNVDKKKKNLESNLKDLKSEIEKMEQSAPAQGKHAEKNKSRRNTALKTMVMDY